MEYASKNGIFSPDGRIIPVEYAQNASSQGNTIIIKVIEGGIMLAYENRQADPLLLQMNDKIKRIDPDRQIYLIYSGLKPDSLQVTDDIITKMRTYRYNTGEEMCFEKISKTIGKYKQQFTVSQRYRPLGLRTILFGIEGGQPMIHVIETDGNVAEYSMCAVGFKSEEVMELIELNGGELSIYQAMHRVMRKDTSQINVFQFTSEGKERIDDDTIKGEISKFE